MKQCRLLAAVVALAAPGVLASDWNTSSGGNSQRNGRSEGRGPSRPTVLWSGGARSTLGWPGVAEGDLLVTTRDAVFEPVNGFFVTAQRLHDGTPLWSVPLPYDPDNPGWYTHVSAIRDGQVYATRAGGCNNPDFYYALAPADGSILWRSEGRVHECYPETPAFARNGDLVIGDFDAVWRIARGDGSTVWRLPRACPITGGCAVSVSGDRGYMWEATAAGLRVTALDLEAGTVLYGLLVTSQNINTPSLALMVGPDGTVYAPVSQGSPQDHFAALRDTGSALVEKWRSPIAYSPFATFTVGRDGSVYFVNPAFRLERRRPSDGAVLNTSMPLSFSIGATVQMALDGGGTLFVVDGQNTLFSFDADLTLRWSQNVASLSESPPILGANGVLVVAGGGTDVRAYQSRLAPMGLAVDAPPTGNGVLEPGDSATVAPSWLNRNAVATALLGTAVSFTGPPGGTYEILDGAADYGPVPAGATGSCTATGDCLQVRASAATRPALHWDATLRERLQDGEDADWVLHVGDSFDDVPRASAYYPFVETLLHHSVTSGCSGGFYCPSSSTAREQMAVFVLAAAEGALYAPPPCRPDAPLFADVPAASSFCRWIEELARRGVVAGCGGENYCPSAPVPRDQMAVFTLLAHEGPDFHPPACVAGQERFADVPATSPFCPWVEELARRGVVAGCGAGNYCPAQPVTREQMAVFVARTFGLQLYGS